MREDELVHSGKNCVADSYTNILLELSSVKKNIPK